MLEDQTEESLGYRPMAYIAQISDVNDIPGRDRIVLVTINGFRTCMPKGVKAGDLVVYHEVGSMVPTGNPLYAFLDKEAKDFNEVDPEWVPDGPVPVAITRTVRRARIKTKKMGDAYSQGFALPLSEVIASGAVSGTWARDWARHSLEEKIARCGYDFTKFLNILKYTPPGSGGPNPKGGSWPEFAPAKTDEDLVQNHMYLLHETMPYNIYITQKLDGQSATYISRPLDPIEEQNGDESLIICSRTRQIHPWKDAPGDKLDNWNSIALALDLKNKIPPSYCVQGEIVGPGIQANRLGLDRKKFFVFNVLKRVDTHWERLGYPEAVSLVTSWGLDFVPIITAGPTLKEMFHTDDPAQIILGLLRLSTSQRYGNGFPAEGIVVRPMSPVYASKNHKTLSFKIINPEFEIKTSK